MGKSIQEISSYFRKIKVEITITKLMYHEKG